MLRRISDQVGQLTADLAAVKQQVTDQQYAIDQFRQDTVAAAVAAALADIRTAVPEGAESVVDGRVADIERELVTIGGAIARLEDRLRSTAAPAPEAAAPQPPSPTRAAAGPEPKTPGEGPSDVATLRAAAGISAARLLAHRDTWEFLVKRAGTDQHFHVPGAVTEVDETVCAHLSGPSLVAVLTSLDDVRRDTAADLGTQAIAHHLHQRIGDIVKEIAQDPRTGPDCDPVTIRVDDRLKPDGESDEQR
ncbi:hypothetical protein [Streptomyces sp. NPDC092370]|uniref:hypothetical protein n=1 Tax=Streptomyces sp. NPDC092370 TaxID=3366016 RepID=UPI003816EDC2